MKRTIGLSFTLLVVAATLVLANSGLAVFNWKTTSLDLGRIQQAKPVVVTYTFTNKGQEPLVITAARGSCGCTDVSYPKQPIMPGSSADIKGTFNAATVGAFNKSISLESNAEGGVVALLFKGEVVASSQGSSR